MALLVIYILIFILQIVLLVKSVRRKTNRFWKYLFLIELIPMVTASYLVGYFDDLPGYGFMPGLTYLGEYLFSFGAAILYGFMFLITIIFSLCIKKK